MLVWFHILRWLGRLSGMAVVGLCIVFALGEGFVPAQLGGMQEWALFLCFPVLVCIGLLLGWSSELAGGFLSVAGLAGFMLLETLFDGSPPSSILFPTFCVPGLLLILAGLMARAQNAEQ